MIEDLAENQIFVFGSNLSGIHAGGAARQAKEQFGAVDGVGEGMTGQCYAFPSLGINLQKRSEERLRKSVARFYAVAVANPDKEFLLTKVGCGIAGYPESKMKALFVDAPRNVLLPDDWLITA